MLTEDERLELFESNKNLVPFYIKDKWYAKFMEMEDLVQEGYSILWKCTETFNPSLGVQFSSYVCNQLFYHLNDYANHYRFGGLYAARYQDAISAASCAYRECRSIETVCQERKLSKSQRDIAYMMSNGKGAFVSLSTPILEDSGRELQDLIPSDLNLEEEICTKINDEVLLHRVYVDFVNYYNSKHVSLNPELNSKLLIEFLNNIFYDRKTYKQIAEENGVSLPIVRARFEKFRKSLKQWAPKACGLR